MNIFHWQRSLPCCEPDVQSTRPDMCAGNRTTDEWVNLKQWGMSLWWPLLALLSCALCLTQVIATYLKSCTMTSWNGNIFRVTGPLCGEFTGHRWIPHTKASDAEPWCFLWSVPWINGWVNNHEAGDLRRHRAHYDVIVMWWDLTTWQGTYSLKYCLYQHILNNIY